MGYVGNSPALDETVSSSQIVDLTIATADIANDAVTLAKMAGGTDGNVISYDASGDPVAIATGSDGQVLTSTGAGSPPAFEALPSSVSALDGLSDAVTTATSNIGLGSTALDSIDASNGNYNVAVGINAGTALTTADNSIFIGYNAGLVHTTGGNNIAIGMGAMDDTDANDCPTSTDNIFIGLDSGGGTWTTNDCNLNVAVGNYTLDGAMNGAVNNTAIGHNALSAIVDGSSNNAIGAGAADALTDGGDSVFIGCDAGGATTSVSQVVIVGHSAGAGVLTSAANGAVLIGNSAGAALTTGANIVAIGKSAAAALTTGTQCIAIGAGAMDAQEFGPRNIAIGTNAMGDTAALSDANDLSAIDNMFIGYNSGAGTWADTVNVRQNVAIGNYTMDDNISGAQANVVIGYAAGGVITSAASNTIVGFEAGGQLTTGTANIFVGYASGGSLVTGNKNIAIGYNHNLGATDMSECIMLGHSYSSTAEAAFFGYDGAHIRCDYKSDATWDYVSDERMKNVTGDSPLGLDFLNDIRVVAYTKKPRGEYPTAWQHYKEDVTEPDDDFTHHGVLAQDVKAALDDLSVDYFHGWSQDPDGSQRIGESAFVFPLIKAVQELTARLETLESA